MCGIAGRFNFDPSRAVDPGVLGDMTDAIRHRGPDAAGFFRDGAIGLGHRRLSIIDLHTGDQPVANEDGAILGAVQAGSTVILTGASVDGFLAASFDGTGGWLPANAVA